MFFYIMKINYFRGGLTDNSAKMEALKVTFDLLDRVVPYGSFQKPGMDG